MIECICKSLACFGSIVQLIPHQITFIFSTILFTGFGVQMLYKGCYGTQNELEVYDEASSEVEKLKLEHNTDDDEEGYGTIEESPTVTQQTESK